MLGYHIFRKQHTRLYSYQAIKTFSPSMSAVNHNTLRHSRASGRCFSLEGKPQHGVDHLKRYPSYHLTLQRQSFASYAKKPHTSNDVLTLMDIDMKHIHQRVLNTLRQYITNKEMYDIATYYYKGEVDNFYIWTGLPVLIGKALKYHMFKDDRLTETQVHVISIIELVTIFSLLHDDVVDNATIRFNSASANVLWDPHRVVTTGNFIFSIILSEASKLSHEIALSISHMLEAQCRGQYMADMEKVPGENRLAQYFSSIDFKSGSVCLYVGQVVAQALRASDSLTDHVARMFFNFGMTGQVLDDYKDVDEDLGDGAATLPVLLARRKHPDLEAMILRRFRREGDVEAAKGLVQDSEAMEETREVARRFFATALWYLNMVAPSSYKDALEVLANYQFHRKINFYENLKEKQVKRKS